MSQAGSAYPVFAGRERCGIYILEFRDGMRYVGQTRDIVNRYTTHRRRYVDIHALQFASCTAAELNQRERETVRIQERTYSLRNLNPTGQPGGALDLETMVAEGKSITLPGNRAERPQSYATPAPSNTSQLDSAARASSTSRTAYNKLRLREGYPDLTAALGMYLVQAVPAPGDTQGAWSLTALPRTSRTASTRRLATLSIGQMETLFVISRSRPSGRQETAVYINLWSDPKLYRRLFRLRSRSYRLTFSPGTHSISYPVTTVRFDNYTSAPAELLHDFLADAAYHRNIALMRQGSRMFSRFHNAYFAADVLSSSTFRDVATRARKSSADLSTIETSSPRIWRRSSSGPR